MLGHDKRQEKNIVVKGALHKKMTPAGEKCLNIETSCWTSDEEGGRTGAVLADL